MHLQNNESDHLHLVSMFATIICKALSIFSIGLITVIPSSLAASVEGTGDWTVVDLMNRLARVDRASIDFMEIKRSPLLIINTVSRGEIVYRAPDYIEKHTSSPFVERVVIDGESMVIHKTLAGGNDSGETVLTRIYSVDTHPAIRASIESFQGLLSGDYEALKRYYTLALSGSLSSWSLELNSMADNSPGPIKQIALWGSGAFVRRIETLQLDDDRTILEFTYQSLRYRD